MPPWVIPISFLIFFEFIADFFAKEYSLKGGPFFWTIAIIGYIIANSFWLYAISHGSELGRGAMIFSVGSAVLAVSLGIFLFKERMSLTVGIGLILGVISLILLLWE